MHASFQKDAHQQEPFRHGAIIYPLLALGVVAVLIILSAVAYWRSLRLPRALAELIETYGFAWDDGRSGYSITSSKPS